MRPGRDDDTPAVTLGGRTISYRQFGAAIRATGPVRPGAPVAAGPDPIDALAAVFAAAAAGFPVLVTDPAAPPVAPPAAPAGAPFPPGTFLVVVTSGTSGHPRPVLRTAASWSSSFAPFSELTGIGPADRVLLTGPLHATMHLFAAVHTLAIGAHLVDDPTTATVAHAVPSRLAALLDGPDRPGPGSAPLRTVVVAGASLPDELAARARARGIDVVEYYGAAELSFVAARRGPGPLRPFPGAEVQVRDGVLWVRSPYLSLGYPPGVSGPFRRDADGFATVGDLAEIRLGDGDPAGPGLRVRGRGDAAVTTGGATVIAEDVEQVLLTLPGVAAVAVVGVAHPRLGQLVVAVLEPAAGADLRGVRGAARRVLRGPSRPRRWLVADALPHTPGGKVARHRVSAAVAALDAGEPAPDGSPALRALPSTP